MGTGTLALEQRKRSVLSGTAPGNLAAARGSEKKAGTSSPTRDPLGRRPAILLDSDEKSLTTAAARPKSVDARGPKGAATSKTQQAMEKLNAGVGISAPPAHEEYNDWVVEPPDAQTDPIREHYLRVADAVHGVTVTVHRLEYVEERRPSITDLQIDQMKVDEKGEEIEFSISERREVALDMVTQIDDTLHVSDNAINGLKSWLDRQAWALHNMEEGMLERELEHSAATAAAGRNASKLSTVVDDLVENINGQAIKLEGITHAMIAEAYTHLESIDSLREELGISRGRLCVRYIRIPHVMLGPTLCAFMYVCMYAW